MVTKYFVRFQIKARFFARVNGSALVTLSKQIEARRANKLASIRRRQI